MSEREVQIKKFLWDIHGKKSRVSTIILVYATAILSTASILFQFNGLISQIWKIALIVLLYFDISGGVTANLSTPTNLYYQEDNKKRLFFLSLHLLQPGLFILLFPEAYKYFIFTCIFTLACGLFLHQIKDLEKQQNYAATFTTIGIILSFIFTVPFTFLYSIAPLFMIKLLLGFSVKRPSFQKENIL